MDRFFFNDKNGYLVKPGDIECLSKVLIEFLWKPAKCLAMGENG
jgi:hypothetical protein